MLKQNKREGNLHINQGTGENLVEHNERMREFRRCHTGVAMVNGPGYDSSSALLKKTRLVLVTHTLAETGGIRRYFRAKDWLTFVPMWRVAQHRFPPN